jgi:hypothetical protein
MIIGELLTNRSRRRRKTKPALGLRPDDRPCNGPDPLAAVYLYGPDRKAALPTFAGMADFPIVIVKHSKPSRFSTIEVALLCRGHGASRQVGRGLESAQNVVRQGGNQECRAAARNRAGRA